jgi:hypothetical protein
MIWVGPLATELAAVVGLLAGLIAVSGFIAHSGPVFAGDSEERIRKATVGGGLAGLGLGLFVILLSAILTAVSA